MEVGRDLSATPPPNVGTLHPGKPVCLSNTFGQRDILTVLPLQGHCTVIGDV